MIVYAVFLLSSVSFAGGNKTITCSLETKEKAESVTLRVNSAGKIVQWDKRRWGKPSKDANWLNVFGENIEEYGFEWEKSFVAPNGYSILELGTTADSFKVGVKLSAGKGFFTYEDHGSGVGDYGPVELSCK